MSAYENAIEIKGITKKYDGFTLDNVSFDVPKGSIMGFIGQNGAGKSTTIRSLLNIIPVDGGEIKILGLDHIKDEKEIKERIAVVFDELPFHDVFNAKDMSRIFEGIYPKWNRNEYVRYLDRFQLPRKKKIGEFSKGMKGLMGAYLPEKVYENFADEYSEQIVVEYSVMTNSDINALQNKISDLLEEKGITMLTSCDRVSTKDTRKTVLQGSP